MRNLGQFLSEYSRVHNARIAYEIKRGFRTETLSFAQVHSLALKTATFLANCALKKGDTVAIWSPNMPEYPILYFACWLLGIVVVPIDVRTTEETLQLFVTKARCQLGFKSKLVPGKFPHSVMQCYDLEDLRVLVRDLPPLEMLPEVAPDDLAEIAFTSGTTGTPKGVLLTHRNFLTNVSALCQTFPLKTGDRTLSLLPLSHAFEQVIDFLAVFQKGMSVVYLERTNQVTIMRALRKRAVTAVALVPQVLQFLMSGIEREVAKRGKQKIWHALHSIAPFLSMPLRRCLFRRVRLKLGKDLRFFGCGSAPLNRKLARKWENIGIAIYEGYGATETTAVLTINTPAANRPGSVGKALPGVHLCIDPLSHEISATGPNISCGYFQARKKTQQAFVDGWYRTGDIGRLDPEGYLYITGREALRIVLPGGEKVYPEDIENKLNAHPLVRESCVVGVKNEDGEKVHAAVITEEPQRLAEIIRQVNQELSSHEQILAWSAWNQEDFPRTPLLKIDRGKVAEALAGLKAQREEVAQQPAKDPLFSLIARVTDIPGAQIHETDVLATDLALDSLRRVELLSLIEQELGVAILETQITAQTTVAQLREMIKHAEVVSEEIPVSAFNYRPFVVKVRVLLQTLLAFPLHAFFVPMQVSGQENLASVELPAIFYFNHVGIMDAVCVLRALPPAFRQKVVIAINRNLWSEWRKSFVEFWAGGFPFDTEQNIKASLELTGEFLDRGFSLVIAPEGRISLDGALQTFRQGIGFMATHMRVSVVPVKVDPSYREIFPSMEGSFLENFPKKRKGVWVKIGKPLIFSEHSSRELATREMQQAMMDL
ncbi:MAG TPA: AMP-binding protein [Ktedonobacteraceae bacterium]|nr:AMP-binding protein [Ktedonobacteraceae bacterium]